MDPGRFGRNGVHATSPVVVELPVAFASARRPSMEVQTVLGRQRNIKIAIPMNVQVRYISTRLLDVTQLLKVIIALNLVRKNWNARI